MLPLRDENPTRRFPVMTVVLIALNIAVFWFVQPASFRSLASTGTETRAEAVFLYEHAMVPCELTHAEPLSPALQASCTGRRAGPADTQAYFPHKNVVLSLFASMALHANWLHLLGNVWFLWIFGNNVEDRLGRLRYFALYAVGGVAAGLGQVAASPNSIVPMIGASGAIAAVLGAYLFLFPRARVMAIVLPVFFLPFVVPAWFLLITWLVMQFFTNPNSGVAWVAHVSGFTFGLLAVAVARPLGRARTPLG